ncbi:MFS transporter [Amycolatopsis sp. CA-230715]|uniref:MFS transporter n=1 Tax=Amycolatopsis sp. CA-230715 TaxID=2745196 RepID=UPI001C02A16C|nr:MFS transporter [Amycolatopsis sp. CA-230715]QWF77085.1 Antiseptic resistance protein [Amycolatopsis sp. CA-230715]
MTAPGTAPERTRWGAVVAVSLGVVLAGLDMTIVAVVLPVLGDDLGAGSSAAQWVLLGYSLPLLALSVPAGRWLDRADPRAAFAFAVGGFGVASALIALAPGFALVVAARVLQGLFGALVGVTVLPIVGRSVRREHRARAMAVVLTLIPLSGVAGPALGGLLTEAFGWRSVFLVNVPVAALAVACGMRAIARERAGLPVPDRGMLAEVLVLGAASAALFLALDLFGRRSGLVPPLLLVAVAAVGTAVWAVLRPSRPVLALVRAPGIPGALLALTSATAAVGAVNFLVPYFLATTANAAPGEIGAALLCLSAAMAVTSPVAGVVADRVGSGRVAFAGALVFAGGTASLLCTGDSATPGGLAWRLALLGVGQGLFAGPNAAVLLDLTPANRFGTSAGVSALARNLGFSLGPALGALTWATAEDPAAGFRAGAIAVLAVAALSAAASLPRHGKPAALRAPRTTSGRGPRARR